MAVGLQSRVRRGRWELAESGPLVACTVDRSVTGVELAVGLMVTLGAMGAVAAGGGSWPAIGFAAVVGLVLGHVPALRRGGAVVRLEGSDGALTWQLIEGGEVVEEERVPLREVAQVLVMPDEGAGWGLELQVRRAVGVRIWAPRLPIASRVEAERLADWIRGEAGNLGPEPVLVDDARARGPW